MLRAVFGITGWSGIDARCSTTTRASGLATVLRSLQFAYHDDELVGQCVGNVACPDG